MISLMIKGNSVVKQERLKKSNGSSSIKNNGNHTLTNITNKSMNLVSVIDEEYGKDVRNYINKHADLNRPETALFSTTTRFNILQLPDNKYATIVNLKRVNCYRRVNKFFETVNEKLPVGGIFINSVEVYTNRKARLLKKTPAPINRIHYFFDVIFTRLIPKLPGFKEIYFGITKGKNRVLSKAETFGRLYSCGFEVINEKFIDDKLYFVAKKVKEPVYDNNPTYGPLISLKRHGKDGKLFSVYKLRTMHAYSEYLQEYIYQQNDLQEGGKFKNDFRITTEGKFFRKTWLDEIPMLINVLKRDMKIVGVRPLSSHYFNLYTEELKQKRIKYKPGLVPPFYVDLPKTLEEIMESEMRYLEAYENHPVLTDIKYFFKAFYNILVRRARSA